MSELLRVEICTSMIQRGQIRGLGQHFNWFNSFIKVCVPIQCDNPGELFVADFVLVFLLLLFFWGQYPSTSLCTATTRTEFLCPHQQCKHASIPQEYPRWPLSGKFILSIVYSQAGNPVNVFPFSPHILCSRDHSPGMAAPSLSGVARFNTTLHASSPVGHHQGAAHSPNSTINETVLKPIIPDLCMEQLWSEATACHRLEAGFGENKPFFFGSGAILRGFLFLKCFPVQIR